MSAIVIPVLAALPVSGIVCAVFCDLPDATPIETHAHHHRVSAGGGERTVPAAGISLHANSSQDCRQDAVLQPLTTAEVRGLHSTTVVPDLALVPGRASGETMNARASSGHESSLPGGTPLARTPLVLRI